MAKKTFSYQQALIELQDILQSLESDQINVDEVAVKVARAVELISFCREKITKTEMEVKKIVGEFEKETIKE